MSGMGRYGGRHGTPFRPSLYGPIVLDEATQVMVELWAVGRFGIDSRVEPVYVDAVGKPMACT